MKSKTDEPVTPDAAGSFGLYVGGRWYRLRIHADRVPEDPLGRLDINLLERVTAHDATASAALDDLLRLHQQGGRARVRLLRVARTLADLADRDRIEAQDLVEAATLRGFARPASLG